MTDQFPNCEPLELGDIVVSQWNGHMGFVMHMHENDVLVTILMYSKHVNNWAWQTVASKTQHEFLIINRELRGHVREP